MSVSLKIKGNKRGNEGVGIDLVAIGDPRFTVIDQQYPGVGTTTDFIVVRHLLDKSVYTIVTKNVTPCDSSRAGVLMISLSIPVGEHVDRLFNLLIELSGFYKSSYMTYDGSLYHFTADTEDAAGFEAILNRYPVRHYPYKAVKMAEDANAVAYLYMTSTQIAELLDDPMRNEFASFGQIVLVPVADPSAMQSTITVPSLMIRDYKIFVNGRATTQTVSDPEKMISISIPENKDYEAASIRFTLDEARRGMVPGIIADDTAQVIYVKLQPKKKEQIIVVTPEEPVKETISKKTTKRRPTTGTIIGIVVIALIVAAGVCWFLGVFGSKDLPENPMNVVEETLGDDPLENPDNFIPSDDNGLFDDIPVESDAKAELIRDQKEGGAEETSKESDGKTGKPTVEGNNQDKTTKPTANDPNAELEDLWIKQLSETMSFSMDDLKNIREGLRGLPPNEKTKKIDSMVKIHERIINRIIIEPFPDNDDLKALAKEARTIPPLAKMLNDLSTKSPEEIDNKCLQIQVNVSKHSTSKVY